jgi:cation transporter-like permease
MVQRERGKALVMAFMAAVTCYFLAIVFARAMGGAGGAAEVIVFGLGAAFGLEFLWTAWTRLWGRAREPADR